MKKILSIIAVPFLLTACAVQPQQASSGALAVAATFYPLAHIAEQVGGNNVDVLQITPSGVEPHDYEPSPQKLVAVQSAKLFLLNGSGLDPWAERVGENLAAKGVVVLTATDEVTLLPGEEDEHDPHIWLDPLLMQQLTDRVRDALIAIDPVHAEDYRSNASAYTSKLAALDQAYKDGLASCELREVITSHNAFSYLAKRYNLTMLSIAGISPEDEPSPRRMAEIADLAQEKHIDTMFFETLVSPKIAETIAHEIGATTAVINPIEGISDEERLAGEDYIALMKENLSTLRTALKCQ